jgi:hypothetical protein
MVANNNKRAIGKLATTKRFYVGHRPVLDSSHIKQTLAEAVAQAVQKCEQTGEEQIVVKVIRVVRQKPQPVVVETV